MSALMSPLTLPLWGKASATPRPAPSKAQSYAAAHPKAEGVLRVHFIDIGQGDSALLEGPTGKRVLIDSGPSKSGDALMAYLKAVGAERIDMMINTHPHADHIGNAARVLNTLKVGLVLDSGFLHPIKAYRDLIEAIEQTHVPLKLARKGRDIDIGGGATLRILGPEEPLISGSRSDPNSNSIVFSLTYKGERALFTGDAEEETEARLLRSPERLPASLLKVAHHGSRHASSDHFLSAVSPQAAVISCSERNRYGHPAPETMARLKRHNVKVWVTATQGTVVADTSGEGWRLNGEPTTSAQPAHAPLAHTATAHTPPPQTTATPQQKAGLININTANASELKGLPGIGPTLAKRIIKARAEAPFASAEELRRVKGIGPKTVQKITGRVSF